MKPTVYQVHVDKPLTNLAINWSPQGMVADSVCPFVKVKKRTDLIYKIDRTRMSGHAGSSPTGFELLRAPTGQTGSKGGWELSTQSYRVEEHGLHDIIHPDVVAEADDPLEIRGDTTEALTEDLKRMREFRVMNLYTTSGNYASGHVATTPSTKWDTHSADIKTVVDDGVDKIQEALLGVPRSQIFIIMNRLVYRHVKENDDLKARVQYVARTTAKQIGPKLIADYWDVGGIVVADSFYNTANEGQTESLSLIWPNDLILVHLERPSRKFLGFGMTYTTKGGGFQTTTWRDPSRKNAEIIEVTNYADEAIINNFAAYLIPTVIT